MKFVKDDGGQAAAGHTKEVNDCVCRAIAIATERPYQEIWDRLRQLFGKHGIIKPCGVVDFVENELMDSLGWTWVPDSRAHLVREELPLGRLVVGIYKHSVAVIDGVMHDTKNCSLYPDGTPKRIWGYFEKRAANKEGALNPERKRLLDIVAKLLAKADGGATNEEAESFKAKAAELIARYDIEFDSVKDLEKYEAITEFKVGRVPSYERALFWNLAPFCGVLGLSGTCKNGGT